MKLLFLAFGIISFLAQTTQGGWGERKCWNDLGRCRKHCTDWQVKHSLCADKSKCCVPKDRLPNDSGDFYEFWTQGTTPSVEAGALTRSPGAAGTDGTPVNTPGKPAGGDSAQPTAGAGGPAATPAPAGPPPPASAGPPPPAAAATPAPAAGDAAAATPADAGAAAASTAAPAADATTTAAAK